MERVVIIGSGGAGKSTLARRLGARTGLPVVHLDVEYWRPGLVETPGDEWHARVAELIEQERWIMDGNFGSTMRARIARSDTVVFLDMPTSLCTWRIIDRALGVRDGGRSRPDMAEGCEERIDPEFIEWVYHYRERSRPAVMEILDGVRGEKDVVELTSGRAVERWLRAVPPTGEGAKKGRLSP